MSGNSDAGRRRVAVTGIGPVTPVGIGIEEFWSSLAEGRSGIGKLQAFDTTDYPSRIAGEVLDFEPERFMEPAETRRMERFAQFAVAAARLAISDAALEEAALASGRTGVVIGTGIGGIGAYEQQLRVLLDRGPRRVSPHTVALMIPNMAAGQIAMRLGVRGPNDCTVTACAASGHAIARAVDWIKDGRVDACLVGGAESAITPLTLAAFCSARALSTRNEDPEAASRPFDRGRDGFVLSEGSVVLVLEDMASAQRRGARIYAELAGYGASADGFHETAPDPEGSGAIAAMEGALADARLAAADVGYINAHGTSTQLGDVAETSAIRKVFGDHADRLAVSSTKSVTGHLLGAAGAAEAAATVLALWHGVLPPTATLEEPDPECDLDYVPGKARSSDTHTALSNSFGFGGQNVSLAFVRAPAEAA